MRLGSIIPGELRCSDFIHLYHDLVSIFVLSCLHGKEKNSHHHHHHHHQSFKD